MIPHKPMCDGLHMPEVECNMNGGREGRVHSGMRRRDWIFAAIMFFVIMMLGILVWGSLLLEVAKKTPGMP